MIRVFFFYVNHNKLIIQIKVTKLLDIWKVTNITMSRMQFDWYNWEDIFQSIKTKKTQVSKISQKNIFFVL